MRHLLNPWQQKTITELETDGYRIVEIMTIEGRYTNKNGCVLCYGVLVKIINEQQRDMSMVYVYPGGVHNHSSYTPNDREFEKLMNFIKLADEIGEEQALTVMSI